MAVSNNQDLRKRLEEMPKVFLLGLPHSGSTFIHSLIDGHPQILVVPFVLRVHDRCWEEGMEYTPAEKIPAIVKRLFSAKACAQTTHPGCELLATERFHERLINLLQAYPFSRRNFFLSFYEAYVIESGSNIDDFRVLFEHSHTTFCVDAILSDFPDAKFIQPMRDPRALYNSYVVQVKRTGVVKEYWNVKRLLHGYGNVRHYKRIFSPERYLVLRNEDLLPPLNDEMDRTAKWLGVDFSETMLETTYGGKSWKGNTAYRDAGKVTPKTMSTRWKTDLNPLDQKMVEFLFSRDIRLHGYEFLHLANPLKRWIVGYLSTVFASQSFSLASAEGGKDKVKLLVGRLCAAVYRPQLFFLYMFGYASIRVVFPGVYWLTPTFRAQVMECLGRLPVVSKVLADRRKKAFQ